MGYGPTHPFRESPWHCLTRREPGHPKAVPVDRTCLTKGKTGGSSRVSDTVGSSLFPNRGFSRLTDVGDRAGEVYEALWLASAQRSPDFKERAAAAYMSALASANGHMDRRSEEYRHLYNKCAVFCPNGRA